MEEQAGLAVLVADPEVIPSEVVSAEATEETPKEEATEAQTDWEAQYRAAEKARQQLEHKARSLEGSVRRQGETDALLAELVANQKAQAQTQAALLAAIETGETDGLRGKINEGEQQLREAQASTVFNRYYSAMFESLVGTTTDAEGNHIFDVAKARAILGPDATGKSDEMVILLADPAYEEVRNIWAQALPKGDQTPSHERKPENLAEALKEANKVSKLALTRKHKAELEAAKKAGSKGAREALLDLDGGRGTSGGSEDWRSLSPTQKIALGMREQAQKGLS